MTFALGEDRVCHTITTTEDILCESHPENEDFFSDLALVMGFDVTIIPSTARVIIDDTNEPECRKFAMFFCNMKFILQECTLMIC